VPSGRNLPLCLVSLCVLTVLPAPKIATQQSEAPNWQDWSFLLGEWTGVGSGQPGQGAGKFSFKPDLQRRVLVRTNYAEYPATKDRPAFRHDDLMIVYRGPASVPAQAILFRQRRACDPLHGNGQRIRENRNVPQRTAARWPELPSDLCWQGNRYDEYQIRDCSSRQA
jgi:hypothetical protein